MTSMNQPVVCIRQVPGEAANSLLEAVLDACGFWARLESVRRARRLPRKRVVIVVKADLDVFNLALPSGTDPQLVAHLATLLQRRGYRSITVLDARNGRDDWLLNREPLMVADLLGYDFSGQLYEMAGDGDSGSAADIWSGADFRINFAKNRTHESQAYALCVYNLLGVAPYSSARTDPAGRCLGVLRDAPPNFNLIDAVVSFHGAAGDRAPVALTTCTVIGGTDALLIDIAGAAKMGLDPYLSPVNAKCLRTLEMPSLAGIDGDLSPYPMWRNVHPLVAESARRRNQAIGLGGAAEAWFQTVDRESFPFREFYSERLNSFIAPLVARIGEDPRAQWLVVLLNAAIAAVGNGILAQHTLFAKGKLERQVRPIEIDLDRFNDDHFLQLPAYLSGYELLMRDAEVLRGGLRLRRLDDATLFFAAHDFPLPYDEFVSRVNIGHAIQYMNDYIGGSLVTVAEDDHGRVRMQAERNLYLQQPNWMVLFGGDVIDVEKIELLEYGADRQRISWRTVSSPNGSAQHDDGWVSFLRTDTNCVRVVIFTRQKFALPIFFELARIDLFPGIRDPIIEAGYRNFFERTVANIQARYDGREFRVGYERPADLVGDSSPGAVARHLATALATLSELLRNRGDIAGLGEWFAARSWTSGGVRSPVLDGDGFRHFGPTPTGTRYDRPGSELTDAARRVGEALADTPGFFAGLATAVQRDFEAFADRQPGDAP